MSDDQKTMTLRRMRGLLLRGVTPQRIAKTIGFDAETAEQEKTRLRSRGILPFDETKLYPVVSMAYLLGILPRRVRVICQQGRLGMKVAGQLYLIRGDEMLGFLLRDRPRGGAGIQARRAEQDPEPLAGYRRERKPHKGKVSGKVTV